MNPKDRSQQVLLVRPRPGTSITVLRHAQPSPSLHHFKAGGESWRNGITCPLLTFPFDLLKERHIRTFPVIWTLLHTFSVGTSNHVHPFPFPPTSLHGNGINTSTETTNIARSDSREDGRRKVLNIQVLETCLLSAPSINCVY